MTKWLSQFNCYTILFNLEAPRIWGTVIRHVTTFMLPDQSQCSTAMQLVAFLVEKIGVAWYGTVIYWYPKTCERVNKYFLTNLNENDLCWHWINIFIPQNISLVIEVEQIFFLHVQYFVLELNEYSCWIEIACWNSINIHCCI